MTLYMMRLDPDMRRATRWGAERGVSPPDADAGYLWHALLTEAFGDRAPKPWRFVERGSSSPHLLGYVGADRSELLDYSRAFADPAACAALGLDTLAVKPMPERFPAGGRLGFEVRLRPVVRTSFTLEGARRKDNRARVEIDAALHAALAAREADPEAPPPDVDEVYKSWLCERLTCGGAKAETRSMKLVWRRRAAIVRKDAARRTGVHGRKGGGPDIGIAGALEVVDSSAFSDLLAHGVGRHRAFGFGMLLLRRA